MTNLDFLLLRQTLTQNGSVQLKVKVIPNAARNEFAGMFGEDTFKIRIKAPAREGKANRELIRFLTKELNIRQEQIIIRSGHTTPQKIIHITL